MQQLVYMSQPFGYSEATLAGILTVARSKNAQHDITGALICRSDIYLQLLEGPVGKIETLFENIRTDDRHLDIHVLIRARVEDRLFPEWAMKHDPAQTWLFDSEEVRQGALQRASAREVREIFLRAAGA